MTPPRISDSDKRRFLDDLGIGFAMFCDDHALSVDEGEELARSVGDAVWDVAENRADNPAVPR